MAEYLIQDTTLTAIGDAIRAKTGSTELIIPENMPTEIEGIQSGSSEEWINQISSYASMFYLREFPKDFELVIKYNDFAETNFTRTFAYTKNLKSIKLIGNTLSNVTINNMFESSQVKIIDLTECDIKTGTNKVQYLFAGCFYLQSIFGTIDYSNTVGFISAYSNCSELVDIEFLPNNIFYTISFANSNKLSANSIQSIIDGLATVETAQTLTLHSNVKAKLTDEQIAQITSKNWNLA